MNRDRWPLVLGVIAGLLALVTTASATPLKSPKRVVGQRTVDLTPLFRWWTNRTGDRPLVAWVHVTGTVVATNNYGWVLEAQVEPSKGAKTGEGTNSTQGGSTKRIVMQHPPLHDRANFEQLQAQLKALNDQRTQAAKVQADAHRQLHAGSSGVHRFDAKAAAWERSDLNATEQNAAAEKKRLDKQIQETKAKLAAWPSPDHYEVDCFALDTGSQVSRVPVYDHGQSWQ